MSDGLQMICGFDIVDRFGTNVCDYHVVSDPGFLDFSGKTNSLFVDLCYKAAMAGQAVATAMLRFASDPSKLFDQFKDKYQAILIDPIFKLFPPQAFVPLALLAMISFVMVSVLRQNSGSNMRVGVRRIIAGLLIGSAVLALAGNPLFFVTMAGNISHTVGAEVKSMVNAPDFASHMADTMLAPLVQTANFGVPLPESCQGSWSAAMRSGGDALPSCVQGEPEITGSNVAATFMLMLATFPITLFALLLVIGSVLHALLSLFYSAMVLPAATVSLFQGKRYSTFSQSLGKAIAHTIFIAIITAIAYIGTTIASGLSEAIASTASKKGAEMLLNATGMGVAYTVLCGFVIWLALNSNKLVKKFHGKTANSVQQAVGAGVGAGTGDMMDGLSSPAQAGRQVQSQVRKASRMLPFAAGLGAATLARRGAAANSGGGRFAGAQPTARNVGDLPEPALNEDGTPATRNSVRQRLFSTGTPAGVVGGAPDAANMAGVVPFAAGGRHRSPDQHIDGDETLETREFPPQRFAGATANDLADMSTKIGASYGDAPGTWHMAAQGVPESELPEGATLTDQPGTYGTATVGYRPDRAEPVTIQFPAQSQDGQTGATSQPQKSMPPIPQMGDTPADAAAATQNAKPKRSATVEPGTRGGNENGNPSLQGREEVASSEMRDPDDLQRERVVSSQINADGGYGQNDRRVQGKRRLVAESMKSATHGASIRESIEQERLFDRMNGGYGVAHVDPGSSANNIMFVVDSKGVNTVRRLN